MRAGHSASSHLAERLHEPHWSRISRAARRRTTFASPRQPKQRACGSAIGKLLFHLLRGFVHRGCPDTHFPFFPLPPRVIKDEKNTTKKGGDILSFCGKTTTQTYTVWDRAESQQSPFAVESRQWSPGARSSEFKIGKLVVSRLMIMDIMVGINHTGR